MPKISELTPVTQLGLNTTWPVLDSNSVKRVTFSTIRSALQTPASQTALGVIKVGSGLAIDEDGKLSVTQQQTLPTASSTVLGGVKVGNRLTIANGVLSAVDQSYTLPKASTVTLGGVKVDGATIFINEDGVISSTGEFALPTASSTVLGGIKVGNRLTITNGVLSAIDQSYTLPTASDTVLGGVKVDGQTITINNGVISAEQYTLPTASGSTLGGVKVGSGLTITDGVLSANVNTARTTASVTTASIANNATDNVAITGFKSYMVLKIQTNAAAWVRLYSDVASRTADASRDILTDPAPGSGVLAEFITSGSQTVIVTPAVLGFNNEGTPTTSIPVAVTNKSGSTRTITVILTLLQLEA